MFGFQTSELNSTNLNHIKAARDIILHSIAHLLVVTEDATLRWTTVRELLCSLFPNCVQLPSASLLSPPANCLVFMHSWDISLLLQRYVLSPSFSLYQLHSISPLLCWPVSPSFSLSLALYHSSYSTSCPLPSIFPSINSPLPIGPLSALDTDPISSCPHECVCCHRRCTVIFPPDSPPHSPLKTFYRRCWSKRINWKQCWGRELQPTGMTASPTASPLR